jgi:hypothetical protein
MPHDYADIFQRNQLSESYTPNEVRPSFGVWNRLSLRRGSENPRENQAATQST